MHPILPEYLVEELPSRFIGYPEGTKIYVRPHSFGSATNIEMVGRNNIRVMEETLSGVKTDGLSKNLLTPQDILFLGVYRNLVSSKSNKININTICPKCLKEISIAKSLSVIKFKTIEDFDRDVYPLEVDFTNYKMWFGFATYKDFEFCTTRYKANKMYQLCLQVLKYEDKSTGEVVEKPEFNARTGNKRDITLIEKYVDNVRDILYYLVDEDKDTLDEVVTLLEDYGLKPIDVECPDERCKHKYTVNLDDDNVLVTPFRESGVSPRSRIKLSKSDVDRSDSSETNEFERSTSTSGDGGKTSIEASTPTTTVHLKPKTDDEQIKYFDKKQI